MLQEVHCSQETTDKWTCEWGYKALFSCCSSNKAGVGILFNNNFNCQIHKVFSDPNGRFLICDIVADSKRLTVANIYAPNEDDPNFFQVFFDHLSNFKCEEIIIGGDFNLVLEVEKDKRGGLARTHKNALKVIQDFSENLGLIDIWRLFNPETKRYTWRQNQPVIHCRLDFFLVSESSLCDVTHADILPGFKTDHSMITLNVALHSNPRGKGFWKLNTSLLSEVRYVQEIKTVIENTVNQYKDDISVNPALLWEMIKLKVREKSISYAAYKNVTTRKREEMLEREIAFLEKHIDNSSNGNPSYHIVAERIFTLKKELENIFEYRTKGAIIRSKSQWYNEGERNSAYFLNLEKRHCKQGTISQLKINDTNFVTTDRDILSECTAFYKNLYTSKKPDSLQSTFFSEVNSTSLSNEEQILCEGPLTQTECLEALKKMESDKTPGTDGLPAEFYKVFWKDISPFLIPALNYALDSGCLSVTQRRGVIKLIPKKDAELYFIKNWRPITLLNTDYKIAAKSIANRIKLVLPNLINHDQTGFLKDRFIGENIRLIDSIIQYATEKNIPGLLLFIDFEKAFDSLEWSFIHDTLSFYGFGASLINWVKTLYSNTESCILNNGWASNFFEIQRGVRQGCPLSPYLFILSAEVLAMAIRKNTNIKGISVNNVEIKLSQYADDTTLILDGSRESLFSSLAMLDDFSKVSGLRLNDKKTEALWIGASVGNDKILLSGKELKWPKDKVKSLGLWISTDPELSASLNYNEKLEKVKEILRCWKYRRLTLLGKITVIKSLVVSQLVYLLSPLRSNYRVLNEINDLLYTFLWNGKGDKIKRKVMINDFGDGGLKMIDISSFNKSLKMTWIKKYLDNNNKGKWKIFFDITLQKYGCQNFFSYNLNVKDILSKITTSDGFLKEVLEIWAEVNFEPEIASKNHFLDQQLWHNSLIKIANKTIFFQNWFNKEITRVKHLLGSDNNFLSLSDFRCKYEIDPRPLSFYGLISAVKSIRIDSNFQDLQNTDHEKEPLTTRILQAKKATTLIYKKLISIKSLTPEPSQKKWLQDCDLPTNDNINWTAAYILAKQCTKSTKLIEFQFKLLHRRVSTNNFLFRIGLKGDENCSFCLTSSESLIHLFWTCNHTSHFWNKLTEWLINLNVLPRDYALTNTTALGLRPDISQFALLINYCFLLARYHIWLAKTKEGHPNLTHFIRTLKSRYEIEIKSGDTKKWKPLAGYMRI